MEPAAKRRDGDLYRALARAIWLGAGVFIGLWFLDAITFVLLFFATAFILAIALNPPVCWLERRRIPRVAGAFLVATAILASVGLLGWLVAPHVAKEGASLVQRLPDYLTAFVDQVTDRLSDYPQIRDALELDAQTVGRLLPTAKSFLLRIGRTSLSAAGALVFMLVLGSTALYALARPDPLLKGYIGVFPQRLRDPAERAYVRGAQAVAGWLWSNVIVGGIEAIASTIALTLLNVPGALVWGTLTFFAELVPRFGVYLMAVPPIIVAFSVDPMKALWVLVYYMAQSEITGDFITPLVRSRQMNLHPVSQLFMVMALGSAFGLLGALLATPIAGFVKAFYEEFYLARQPRIADEEERLTRMLNQSLDEETQQTPGEAQPPE